MRRAFAVCVVLLAGCAADPELTVEGTSLTTDEETAVSFTIDVSDATLARGARTSKPAHGTVTIDGLVVTYTPDPDFVGVDAFEVYVEDGAPPSVTAPIDVTVRPVDDVPVATNDRFAALEDVPFEKPFALFLANDIDVDGDTLTITAVGTATNGAVSMDQGVVSFVPDANFAGNASFEYTMSDGTTSSTATVTLNVGMQNDAPVVVDDTVTTLEDTQLQIPIASLLANDIDIEGQTLAFAGVVSSTNCWPAAVNGTLYVTIASNFNGVASFAYRITDGAATSTGFVAVTVTPVNDRPAPQGDMFWINEDNSIDIPIASLLANDIDVDSALTITTIGPTSFGTLLVTGDTLTYTPPSNAWGQTSFSYTVSDGTLSATSSATIYTLSVNDAPVAGNDVVLAAEDSIRYIDTDDLLANDTDIDSLPSALRITSVASISGGTATNKSDFGHIQFDPASNFNGTASFTYTLSDGTSTSTAVVSVTVDPRNDFPSPQADSVTAIEDTALQITASTLLANDTDIDGDVLTVASVIGGWGCSVSIANNVVTFQSWPNYTGLMSFTYRASDGQADRQATVQVTVMPTPDPPIAVDDAGTTTADTPVQLAVATLLANDYDVDGTQPAIVSAGNAVNGDVTFDGTNVTFTPDGGFVGMASFEYTISDGTLTDTATVTITVN